MSNTMPRSPRGAPPVPAQGSMSKLPPPVPRRGHSPRGPPQDSPDLSASRLPRDKFLSTPAMDSQVEGGNEVVVLPRTSEPYSQVQSGQTPNAPPSSRVQSSKEEQKSPYALKIAQGGSMSSPMILSRKSDTQTSPASETTVPPKRPLPELRSKNASAGALPSAATGTPTFGNKKETKLFTKLEKQLFMEQLEEEMEKEMDGDSGIEPKKDVVDSEVLMQLERESKREEEEAAKLEEEEKRRKEEEEIEIRRKEEAKEQERIRQGVEAGKGLQKTKRVVKKTVRVPVKPKCKGLYDYQEQGEAELSFSAGDVILLLGKDPSGWWSGELNGRIGLFPGDWVEELPVEGDGFEETVVEEVVEEEEEQVDPGYNEVLEFEAQPSDDYYESEIQQPDEPAPPVPVGALKKSDRRWDAVGSQKPGVECTECGFMNEGGTSACYSCSSPLEILIEVPRSLRCATCGIMNAMGSVSCEECNTSFTATDSFTAQPVFSSEFKDEEEPPAAVFRLSVKEPPQINIVYGNYDDSSSLELEDLEDIPVFDDVVVQKKGDTLPRDFEDDFEEEQQPADDPLDDIMKRLNAMEEDEDEGPKQQGRASWRDDFDESSDSDELRNFELVVENKKPKRQLPKGAPPPVNRSKRGEVLMQVKTVIQKADPEWVSEFVSAALDQDDWEVAPGAADQVDKFVKRGSPLHLKSAATLDFPVSMVMEVLVPWNMMVKYDDHFSGCTELECASIAPGCVARLTSDLPVIGKRDFVVERFAGKTSSGDHYVLMRSTSMSTNAKADKSFVRSFVRAYGFLVHAVDGNHCKCIHISDFDYDCSVPAVAERQMIKSRFGLLNKMKVVLLQKLSHEMPSSTTSNAMKRLTMNRISVPLNTERDKVANEILTSEQVFVRGLMVMRALYLQPIMLAASNAENVQVFNTFEKISLATDGIIPYNQGLLTELEKKISNWSDTQTIGDVFHCISRFLAVYAPYFRAYEEMMPNLAQLEKNATFVSQLRELKTNIATNQLDLRSYLILPIQRIPRYELLLRDLLDATPEDHPDEALIKTAIAKVEEVNTGINDAMKVVEEQKRLVDISSCFVADPGIVKEGRFLVKEGLLVKQCHNGRANRKFWLFSDLVMYAKVVPGTGLVGSERYLLSEKMDLAHVHLEDVADNFRADPPIMYGFEIDSNKKSFVVYAPNQELKVEWMLAMSKAAALQIHKGGGLDRRSRAASMALGSVQNTDEVLLKPKWQHDDATDGCTMCPQKFTFLNRRHHCRLCGALACGNCTPHKIVVKSWGSEAQRVCRSCFAQTRGQKPPQAAAKSTSPPAKSLSPKVPEKTRAKPAPPPPPQAKNVATGSSPKSQPTSPPPRPRPPPKNSDN